MIRYLAIALGLSLSGLSLAGQTGSKPIRLADVLSGQFAARGAGYGMRSLPDGAHYSMLSSKRDAILRCSYQTGQVVDTLFSVNNARECPFKTFDDYLIGPEGKHILLFTEVEPIYRRSSRAVVHHFDVRRRLVAPLSDQPGKVMIPTFSPDGRMVAFVRDHNIFIKKFEFNTEVQVSTDGKPNHILNGITDWVYEEELETTRLLSWSEDGAFLAWVRSDESHVPEYRIPHYGEQFTPTDYRYKYPKAGQDNAKVSVHIYNVADRSQKRVPIAAEEAYYIPRIAYTGRGQTLAVMTLNRHQNHLRILYVNSKSLVSKTMLEERNERYLMPEFLHELRFTDTGFVFLSERNGYTNLYRFSEQGQRVEPLTTGPCDVTAFYGIDQAGQVYYQVADSAPTVRHVYRRDARGKQTLLGKVGGSNTASFSEGFQYFIATHSSLNEPSTTSIYRTGLERPLRTLEDNQGLRSRLAEHRFRPKELDSLRLADGTVLNGWLVKPHDFDPQRKYPVLMIQYSGPNSQLVLDRYSFGWEYALAEEGFIVACYDGRGTGARGEAWRKGTYLRLGLQESDDQIAAARALSQRPYVDAARIGIWGWSFGGYNTLMALTRGQGVFRLGIAIAPVTDWRSYDTIYTERFMRTPNENPEGYKASSVLELAPALRGHLLLVHGSADDNVHLQNTMAVSERLIQAGIPFEMAIYPDKDHSIRGGRTSLHLYSKMLHFLKANL